MDQHKLKIRPKGVVRKTSFYDNEIVQEILSSIVLPTVKNVLLDIFEKLVFGESRGRRGSFGGGTASRISYRERERPSYLAPKPSFNKIDDLVFETSNEAEAVLHELLERADAYDQATVADLYDVVGLTGDYTSNGFGWTIDDLQRASVTPIRNGVVLNLPQPRPMRHKP